MRAILYFLQLLILQESLSLILPIKQLSPSHKIIPRSKPSRRFSTRSFEVYSTDESNESMMSGGGGNENSIRSKMRKVTGFSLTASRKAIRTTTGLSLTALRTSLRTLTGISVTKSMKWILGLFPLWARYFIQPFLILYYAPLLMLRGLVGQTKISRLRAKAAHEHLVDEWKNAVNVAESVAEDGYWPVHINNEGVLKAVLPPDPETVLGKKVIPDIVDAVVESIEVADTMNQTN